MLKIQKSINGNKVPPWMVTFADLMTLLLTFFVLLLSYSSLDVKKYKQASDSLFEAFNKDKLIGKESEGNGVIKLPLFQQSTDSAEKLKKTENKLEKWLDKTKTILRKEMDDNILLVKQVENGILISIKERVAFASGSEKLQASFIPYLRKIASILPAGKATIVVAGHTDSQPIISDHLLFRSNWDLSTLRATSVVHKLLQISDIPAGKVIAQGHADSKPIASNKTKQGRSINRRVEITLFPEVDRLSQSLNGDNVNEAP